MRGNFSLTQFPSSEKGTLWMQQGRPILDSDWNAQVTLAEDAVRKKVQSLIGKSGGSAETAGFKITPIIGIPINEKSAPNTSFMFLKPNPSLPFPSAQRPARPFHMQIGFTLDGIASGCLCEVPGLFQLHVTSANRLNIKTTIIGKDGSQQNISATGNNVVTPNTLQRLDIVFDGENINIFLAGNEHGKPEASLNIENADPSRFTLMALILGCTLAKNKSSGKLFAKPIAATFWHFCIVDDFLAFAQNMPMGDTLDDEQAGLVCSIDFSKTKGSRNSKLLDRSSYNNDARIWLGANEPPQPTLLDALISNGDYIAGGRFYQNTSPCLASNQPNLPANLPLQSPIHNQENPYKRFFLDCWQRLVTDLEAPANHDLALGDIDTTASLQNVWQVKEIEACSTEMLNTKWQYLTNEQRTGHIKLRRRGDFLAIKNGLLRIEIHHSGWISKWPLNQEILQHAVATTLHDGQRHSLCLKDVDSLGTLAQLDRPVIVFTASEDAQGQYITTKKHRCTITSIVGLSVEESKNILHLTDAAPKPKKGEALFILPIASFKYSNQNGCLSYPVAEMVWLEDNTGLSAQLSSPGYNGLEIKNGDWLEFDNLSLELTEQPGPILEVQDFMPDRLQLLLAAQTGFQTISKHPLELGQFPTLTIWSNVNIADSSRLNEAWFTINDGIELAFDDNGFYRSGQYWTAPLREAAPKGLIWPGIEDNQSEFLPPEGPQHEYIALADITVQNSSLINEDKRHLFRSLIDEPFADLDQKTAQVLLETARVMELLGLPEWPVTKQNLPELLRAAISDIIHNLYDCQLRFLGVKENAPPGFVATGQKIWSPNNDDYNWQLNEEMPAEMVGNGFSANLAGQDVYINQENNSIWAYRGTSIGWRLLTHIPDDRHAYSVTSDNERLYIVGGERKGFIGEGAARHVIALNSMGEWHTVGTMGHYTGYPATICIGDNLLVAGGLDKEGNHIADLGYIDLKRREWHNISTQMPHEGAYTASIAYGNEWLIFGGEYRHPETGDIYVSRRVRSYDPIAKVWFDRAKMPTRLAGHQLFQLEDDILVVGGKKTNNEYSDACYRYTPETDTWQECGFMSEPRAFFGLLSQTQNNERMLIAVGGMIEEGVSSSFIDTCKQDQALYVYE